MRNKQAPRLYLILERDLSPCPSLLQIIVQEWLLVYKLQPTIPISTGHWTLHPLFSLFGSSAMVPMTPMKKGIVLPQRPGLLALLFSLVSGPGW